MKRSANVVLAVMAATAVGASAYTLMPGGDCDRTPADGTTSQSCRATRGGSYHAFGSSSGDSSRSSAATHASTGTTVPASTQHGGFGSTGRSFGAHASHGG
jgi:hypothetical protein